MEYKIIEEENVKNGYIEFPIEYNHVATIISPDEIILSTELNINKYNLTDRSYIKKEFEKIESYRFKYNTLYFYHNIDRIIGGYHIKYFCFTKRNGKTIFLSGSPKFRSDSISTETFIVNRNLLEKMFSFNEEKVDGLYVIHTDHGLFNAFNKIDGNLINKFKILSDSEIEEKYNERIKFFKRLYGTDFSWLPINEIKNYNLTDELFSKRYIMVKCIDGNMCAAYFSIEMIEMNKFEVKISSIPIPNFMDQNEKISTNKNLVYNN